MLAPGKLSFYRLRPKKDFLKILRNLPVDICLIKNKLSTTQGYLGSPTCPANNIL